MFEQLKYKISQNFDLVIWKIGVLLFGNLKYSEFKKFKCRKKLLSESVIILLKCKCCSDVISHCLFSLSEQVKMKEESLQEFSYK